MDKLTVANSGGLIQFEKKREHSFSDCGWKVVKESNKKEASTRMIDFVEASLCWLN
ncbi:hypothetical protein RV10_GL004247 [Enterococcus pallens]|nr:hypothetical protein RV10_GL004247 [Enterococcus pallens]